MRATSSAPRSPSATSGASTDSWCHCLAPGSRRTEARRSRRSAASSSGGRTRCISCWSGRAATLEPGWFGWRQLAGRAHPARGRRWRPPRTRRHRCGLQLVPRGALQPNPGDLRAADRARSWTTSVPAPGPPANGGSRRCVEPNELMTLERLVTRYLDDGEAEAVRARLAAAELPEPGTRGRRRLIEELAYGPDAMERDPVADRAARRRRPRRAAGAVRPAGGHGRGGTSSRCRRRCSCPRPRSSAADAVCVGAARRGERKRRPPTARCGSPPSPCERDVEIVVLSETDRSGLERFGFRVERISGDSPEDARRLRGADPAVLEPRPGPLSGRSTRRVRAG